MVHRCSNCGFKAEDASFFRRERGGLIGGLQTVCAICSPYRPDDWIRVDAARLILVQVTLLVFILINMASGDFKNLLALAIASVSILLTLPLRVFLHEAGHAFMAKALGHEIIEVRVGAGPVVRRMRIFGIVFDIGRYPLASGVTTHLHPQGQITHLESLLITVAGPLANLVAAGLGIWLSLQLNSHGQLVKAVLHGTTLTMEPSYTGIASWFIGMILAGFAAGNILLCALSLWPSLPNGPTGPGSDGWKLFTLWGTPSPIPPPILRFLKVKYYTHCSRHEDAITTALEDLSSPTFGPYYASLILHNMSRSRGERATVNYYLANRITLEDASKADGKSNPVFLHANVAWSAMKDGASELETLAEDMIASAYAYDPESAEISGTYGAWLVTVGRAAEGMPILLDAIRRMSGYMERAEQAGFLARGARQLGDERQAALFDAVAAHLMVTRR